MSDRGRRGGVRADAMLEKGDLDAYAVLKRILRAVEELQDRNQMPERPSH